MASFPRILCPVDFSEDSQAAYRYALSFARHFQAELIVQHTVELWRLPGGDFIGPADSVEKFCQMLLHDGERRVQEFIRRHPEDGIHLKVMVQQGTAPDDILEFSQKQRVDLVVMGVHGRRGFDQSILGPVTERVLRKASCPVLVVQKAADRPSAGETEAASEPVHFSKVLYCTDFSDTAQRALEPALAIAQAYNSDVSVLHVLEDHPASIEDPKEVAAVSQDLSNLIPHDWKGNRIEVAVRSGKPYQRIIDFAQGQKVDLIVLADRGRSAINFAVFGSTTHRVIQFAPCPVLVVRRAN